MERQRLPKRPMPFRFLLQMLRCECYDVNAPNDYMRSNAGHNHLKINKGGGTLYKENVPPPDSIQFCQVRNRTRAARQGVQPA